jgi:hypothetical protein
MIEQLIQLIHEYQSRVREAVELFEQYKGLKQPQHPLEWQLSGIPHKGYLDPGEKFFIFFMGTGVVYVYHQDM